jgi:protein-tyrosine phosphatase
MSESARILVVCTGNVCRSPLTERLLRVRLAQRLGDRGDRIEIGSAGVRALVGSSMTVEAAAELRALGGDDAGFVSRQLTTDLLNNADLVLAATRQHRSDAVSRSPKVLRSAFTLRELHRLLRDADLSGLPGDPADRLRELVQLARGRRGFVPPAQDGEDDVADPYGRSVEVYAATTRQIVPAVDCLVDAISGAAPAGA